MKPRTCQHCGNRIPIDSGFYFDEQLNLLCSKCKKVIIPVDEKSYVDPLPRYPSPYQGHVPAGPHYAAEHSAMAAKPAIGFHHHSADV
jgi:hypothetical protein